MSGFGLFELSALDGTNGVVIETDDPINAGGYVKDSVASGDVNGDGFDDLIIGVPVADLNGDTSGACYVVFGQAEGLGPVFDVSVLNGANGFVIPGEMPGDRLGNSVSVADVDGDGFDDVIVGAYGADPNGSWSGASYVVFGGADGFAAEFNLASLDGTNGFQVSGEAAYDFSGFSVASAGDIDGDGFDELIIGSFYDYGTSYVVFGAEGGFAAELDLSSLDGANGFKINSEAAGVNSSELPVAAAGDVNGDGFDDLIIGARSSNANGLYSGASYVVFGQAGGFSAEIDLSSLDGTNGFKISGEENFAFSGNSVASGDVNGDGFDDVIIGAYFADGLSGQYNAGASYVVFGHTGDFAEVDLSTLDGINGFKIGGESDQDLSGGSVTSGDVNGDGFDDVIIGAAGADSNGYESGAIYTVFGQAEPFPAEIDLSSPDGTSTSAR